MKLQFPKGLFVRILFGKELKQDDGVTSQRFMVKI